MDQIIRYAKVIKIIKKENPKKILEVGSGTNGICKFMNRKIIGLDKDFEDYMGKKNLPINKNLTKLKGDITKKTSFRDNEFDFVICIDVLEHIPSNKRINAILEVLRISKKTYIAFPSGEKGREIDYKLKEYLVKRKRNVPLWLKEHLSLEYPKRGELIQILNHFPNIRYKKMDNENVNLHKIIMIGEFHKISRNILSLISKSFLMKFFDDQFDFSPTYREAYYIEKI